MDKVTESSSVYIEASNFKKTTPFPLHVVFLLCKIGLNTNYEMFCLSNSNSNVDNLLPDLDTNPSIAYYLKFKNPWEFN